LDDATGDLNKDSIAEKVLVVNTNELGEMGTKRAVLVFKNNGKDWCLWHRATGPILPSEHGGMMGDPFESVTIESGTIVIKHFGGSRSKWYSTHRFRFQNGNWELIGATLVQELPCEEKETFDYNLSSGQVVYTHVQQACENGEKLQVVKIIAEENSSDLGKGRYQNVDGEATIIFEEIKSHIADQLELTRE